MDRPRDCYTDEASQTREISYDLPYMQNIKRNYTNEFIYETDSQT